MITKQFASSAFVYINSVDDYDTQPAFSNILIQYQVDATKDEADDPDFYWKDKITDCRLVALVTFPSKEWHLTYEWGNDKGDKPHYIDSTEAGDFVTERLSYEDGYYVSEWWPADTEYDLDI